MYNKFNIKIYFVFECMFIMAESIIIYYKLTYQFIKKRVFEVRGWNLYKLYEWKVVHDCCQIIVKNIVKEDQLSEVFVNK